VIREKLPKKILHKKAARKMLVKLTPGSPKWKGWCLEPRADVVGGRLGLVGVPQQEPDLTAFRDSVAHMWLQYQILKNMFKICWDSNTDLIELRL